jgi:hypothetical protein
VKRVGKLCICLAGGLVLNAGLRAEDVVSPDNPYAPIVTRNVFSINPPPPVDPNKQPAEPPPKITPNGITSVLGHLQALFKVAIPPKPGQPAREQAYILSEGQQQDDIEVTKIDEKAGVVTFNNHGTIQELPLLVATASGPSGLAQGGPGPGPNNPVSRIGSGGGNVNNGGFLPMGNRFGQSGGFGGQNPNISGGNNFNGSMNGGANSGSRLGVVLAGGSGGSLQLGAAPTSSGYSSSTPNNDYTAPQYQDTTPPAQRILLMKAQQEQWQSQGNPFAAIMPSIPQTAPKN